MHPSVFNTNSSRYLRTGCPTKVFYYEAIQVNINESGKYTFFSMSNITTYGYMYNNYFDPNTPSENRQSENYSGCNKVQFKLATQLYSNTTYILVVTTVNANAKGSLEIIVSGLQRVTLKRISKHIVSKFQISHSNLSGLKYISKLRFSSRSTKKNQKFSTKRRVLFP